MLQRLEKLLNQCVAFRASLDVAEGITHRGSLEDIVQDTCVGLADASSIYPLCYFRRQLSNADLLLARLGRLLDQLLDLF